MVCRLLRLYHTSSVPRRTLVDMEHLAHRIGLDCDANRGLAVLGLTVHS